MIPSNDNSPILISINDTCSITSMSRTMINRLRSENRFPVAVQIGDKRIGFVRTEVVQWVQSRIDARAAA